MFKNMLARIRQVMYRMGLIKGIKKLADHKDIQINEDFYKYISNWKALYRGYFSEWHDISYTTIAGPKKRRMASLNMPKVVSQELATLIFNERCEINISEQKLADEIHSIFKKNNFVKKFQDYLEFKFAMGGMVIKPYVENGQLKLSYVTADCFIPISWDHNLIREAVFPNEFTKKGTKYTHLEWHLWEGDTYLIRNEVYENNAGEELGVKVPLKQFFPSLYEEIRISNYKRPGFVYFKPNTANNLDTASPLGISIFANSLDTLHSLDIAFDSYQREFKLGRKRILVPASAINTVIDPNTGQMHRYFDAEDEVYQALSFGDMDANKIADISATLRVDEHIAAINSLLNVMAMQIGFSAGSFTFDGQGVKTATEVVSENSKTFRTKQSHENLIEAGIQELVECIIQVAELYKLFSRPAADYEVTVAFDDSIAEDQAAEINTQVQLVTNKLTTRKKAIMKIHGFSEEEAEVMMKEIGEENKTMTPEMVDFFGINKQKQETN
ncbi:phage portal protein [Cytobacillus firmus]|uniref:phage portal protein n=1 Tax=Cytobacillus firmus TaxID=1399 RepID=UPI002040245D|nr:phage portal protein [Cytobacillus firmus]MCM3705327.1 phage portal protein [Cytobacillus firmus]